MKQHVTLRCKKNSTGFQALVAELKARGVKVTLSKTEGLSWGRKSDKLEELGKLKAAGVPVPPFSLEPHAGWLGRKRHHHGANDLLRPPAEPDYYVKEMRVEKEFRIHVFKGKVIRRGLKVPKENAHPRFRTLEAGWALSYTEESRRQIPDDARIVAKRAVEAMGYTFGAVDMGITSNGNLVVWEVNSAPGLVGGTVRSYADAILREGL